MRILLKLTALPVVILLACLPSRPSKPGNLQLRPGQVYTFSAVVRGTNRYRDHIEEFTEAVNGRLAVLPSGAFRVNSTHGDCPLLSPPGIGNRRDHVQLGYTIQCGGLRLQLSGMTEGSGSGSLSVLIDEYRETRGNCLEHAVNPTTGGAGPCINYDWLLTKQRRWSGREPVLFAAL